MKMILARLTAAASLCLISGTAQAAVTYKLSTDSGVAVSFETAGPITSAYSISDFGGQRCGYSTMTVLWAACTSVSLTPNVSTSAGTAVEIWINARPGNVSFQFASDVLGTNGTYKATNKTLGTLSLVVSGVPVRSEGAAAAVPEPATWALMLAGFGLTGAAMRRRRHAGARRVAA